MFELGTLSRPNEGLGLNNLSFITVLSREIVRKLQRIRE